MTNILNTVAPCNSCLGNPKVKCSDIDECKQGKCPGVSSYCRNSPGGYQCYCPLGYEGDPVVACTDIDECSIDDPCDDQTEKCVNTAGSYLCHCIGWFQGLKLPIMIPCNLSNLMFEIK